MINNAYKYDTLDKKSVLVCNNYRKPWGWGYLMTTTNNYKVLEIEISDNALTTHFINNELMIKNQLYKILEFKSLYPNSKYYKQANLKLIILQQIL